MNKAMFFASVLLIALAITGHAPAQSTAESPEVTVITSDTLTFDYKKQFALFDNNVVVVDPRLKIYADKMRVTFSKNNKAESVVAEGNVLIVQDDKRARAMKAEYDVVSGLITLSGSPMITRGSDIITAETIKFWRDEERMVAEPQSRLVINTSGEFTHEKLFMEPVRGR